MLDEHRFFCPMEGCEHSKNTAFDRVKASKKKVNFNTLGLAYNEALAHQKECEYRKRNCPRRCGVKLFNRDLDEHLPKCRNFVHTCPDCEITSYPNREGQDQGPHDCFQALVRATQKNSKELINLEQTLGINYELINNKCPKGKNMVVHRGMILYYLGDSSSKRPKCNMCNKPDLHYHDFFYRCEEFTSCKCGYDICRHCALINCDPPILKDKEKFNFHPCQMTKRGNNEKFDGRWCCDATQSQIFPMANGSCESNMHPARHHSEHV